MATTYVSSLQQAIESKHGCGAKHLESVQVTEKTENKIEWEGYVEVFKLTGHPEAQYAYAWSSKKNAANPTIVLSIPPIDTPQAAVRATL